MKQIGKILMWVMLLTLMMMPFASAAVSRTFSKTTANSGETITATYTPSSSSLKFWAINEPIPSGWSVTAPGVVGGSCSLDGGYMRCYSASQTAGGVASSIALSWKAGSSNGIFTGDWATDSQTGAFTQQTVSVGGGNPCTPKTCSTLGKTCGTWSDGCGGTLNCGSACGGGGSCTGEQVSCDGKCKYTCETGFCAGVYNLFGSNDYCVAVIIVLAAVGFMVLKSTFK